MPPKLLDTVRQRLIDRGFGRRYVARLIDELSDHFQCSYEQYIAGGATATEARQRAERDLGDVESILREIVSRPVLAPLSCKRPLLSFVGGPLMLVVLSAGVFYLIECGIFVGATRVLDVKSTDPALRRVFLGAYSLFVYGITPLLALLFCLTARWRRRSALWALCACGTLSLIGGLVKTWLVLCPASGSVFFLSRFGVDLARLISPVAVFVIFAVIFCWLRPGRMSAAM